MKRKPLSQVKSIWRDQICADNELRPATFKLGYVMADHITMAKSAAKYKRTGKIVIWPSQKRLREKTALALDTISAGVAQLIKHGHLKRLKRGNHVTGSNRYRLVMLDASSAGSSI